MSIGLTQILVVLVIVLLLFGLKRINSIEFIYFFIHNVIMPFLILKLHI